MGRPRQGTASNSPSRHHLPTHSDKLARRRRFLAHLQTWAYDHQKRSKDFRGWITASSENNSFALGEPVLCLIRSVSTRAEEVSKIHVKLVRRVTGRGGKVYSVPRTYRALIRSGAGWLQDEEWFERQARSKMRLECPSPLPDRKSSRLRAVSGYGSSASPSSAYQRFPIDHHHGELVKTSEWIHLGPSFTLLALPKEIRLQILEYVLDKPETFIFNGQRQNRKGRELSQYWASYKDFRACTGVCRQLDLEVNHYLLSTTTFTFQTRKGFVDFLSTIGLNNRGSLRKICLQFHEYDYFDIFTPHHLVTMLDVPVWNPDRKFLRACLDSMNLETFIIRLHERWKFTEVHSESRSYTLRKRGYAWDKTSIDVSWIIRSVLSIYPNATFETANWPHLPVEAKLDLNVRGVQSMLGWDALIHSALDPDDTSYVRDWLDRPPKSVISRDSNRDCSCLQLLRELNPYSSACLRSSCFGACREQARKSTSILSSDVFTLNNLRHATFGVGCCNCGLDTLGL